MRKLNKHDTAEKLLLCLIKDVAYALGDFVSCKTKVDAIEVVDRSRTRGLTILMDDLPALAKLYERGLDTEVFPWDKYPKSLRRSRGRSPIFGELISKSFRECGEILDVTPELVQSTRSLLLLFKKVVEDASDSAKALARKEFVHLDENLPEIHSYWNGGPFERLFGLDHFNDHDHLVALGHVFRWMDLLIPRLVQYGPRFYEELEYVRPKHGPGAVSDVDARGDKYMFPSWPESLSSLFPSNGWASHLHSTAEDSLPDTWGSNPCSKLICVPKTLSKPRVIASEPTAMQYCQQAMMVMLRRMVSDSSLRHFISFKDQEISRSLLRERDDVATIDLSSASDRLTPNLVQMVFRNAPEVLEGLRAVRTPLCDIGDAHGVITLRKFAPMGSAVTFPVQSIVYTVIVLAAVCYEEYGKLETQTDPWIAAMRAMRKYENQIQVFGDDMIVPKHTSLTVVLTLEACGLKVNRDKSFTGRFKESCGMDVYDRHEVTPLYLRSLEPTVGTPNVASIVQVSNNAWEKGYWNLATAIAEQVPRKLRAFIPVSSMPLPSLRYVTFRNGVRYRTTRRKWNSHFHYWMVKGFVPRYSQSKAYRNDWADLLQYFIEVPAHVSGGIQPTSHDVGRVDRCRMSYDVRWVREISL